MSYKRKNHALAWFSLLSLAFWAEFSYAVNVDGVRLWRAPDHTRVVFDLSDPVDHKVFTLSNPNRLVIDINQTKMKASFDQLDLKNSPIKKLRHGPRNNKDLRVVLDVSGKVKPRSFLLKKHAGKPDRLVVDLYEAKESVKTLVSTSVNQNNSKRDIIIALDAGHGGEDPGALGPRKEKEKYIVMAIAKALEKEINAQPGYKAVLTRTGDYYIPLKTRRNKARQMRADLFISIHADAFTSPKASGASVFALSRKGATSETARFLATRENDADLIGGVGEVKISGMEKYLASMIVDLSMTETLADSLDVGGRVLKEIGGVTKLHKKHVEQAGFLVLKSPDVPSILIETGFISNPTEARKLSTHTHRVKMASAIFRGVKDYFYHMPPENSYVAWQKRTNKAIKYTISHGDTLSGIAKRYSTTVAKIKQANQMKNNSIRIGQRITIPTS